MARLPAFLRALLRRRRLPRSRLAARHLIRRKADNAVFVPHHLGYGAAMAALFSRDRQYWFIPVRWWRGRWVAAIDLGWSPDSHRDFTIHPLPGRQRVTAVGRKAAMPISVGGLQGSH